MPPPESFRDTESYYSVLGHETCHWTKHPSRLDRGLGRKRWGDEGYAMEELVAELGAAFLCADLELTPEPRGDHASYLDNWLKVLKSDSRAIFAAASHAQRAGDSCTACSRLGRSRGPREPPRGFAVAAELRQDLSPANCPHEPSQASVRHAAMTKPDNQLPAPVRTAAATARRMESRAAVTTGLVRAERRFPPGGRAHCSWAVL